MKRFCLLIISVFIFITLNARQLHEWWFLGVAHTTLSENYTKIFEEFDEGDEFELKFGCLRGLQIGYSAVVQHENNMSWGIDARYVEKGWTTEAKNYPQQGLISQYTVKNSYLDLVLKGGYFMPEIVNVIWQPYAGLGMSAFLNSEAPIKTNVEVHHSFIIGLDVNYTKKAMLNVNYSFGLTEIMQGEPKAKYNSLSFALGRKF